MPDRPRARRRGESAVEPCARCRSRRYVDSTDVDEGVVCTGCLTPAEQRDVPPAGGPTLPDVEPS